MKKYLNRVIDLYSTRSDRALHEVLRVGTLGAVLGMIVGAVATGALMAAGVGLFDTRAMAGALIMISNGMAVGALIGAIFGARNHRGHVAGLPMQALGQGQLVPLAVTTTGQRAGQPPETRQRGNTP